MAVSPDTGLARSQSVTVTGSGLASDALALVAECANGVTSATQCGPITFTQADSTGTFSTTLTVSRFIGSDCAIGGCFIALVDEFGSGFVATHPITFDPTTPPITLSLIHI